MKREIALVHETVLHRHFSPAWCSWRKRVSGVIGNVRLGRSQDQRAHPLLLRFASLHRVALAAAIQEHCSLATNIDQYRFTTVHVLLIDIFFATGVPSTSVCKHLGYMTSETGPLVYSGHSFFDAWATPYLKR